MIIQSANLALRFLLELCMLAAFGFWRFHGDQKTWLVKIGLGVGAPLAAAIIWGAFVAEGVVCAGCSLPDYSRSSHFRIRRRSDLSIGKPVLSAVFAVAYVINRILMYIWNQ